MVKYYEDLEAQDDQDLPAREHECPPTETSPAALGQCVPQEKKERL